MVNHLKFVAAFVFALLLFPSLAHSQPPCNTRDSILADLASRYQEAPIAMGVTSSGGLIEVLSDGKGGTWSIIVSGPDGIACLIASGDGWRAVKFDPSNSGPDT